MELSTQAPSPPAISPATTPSFPASSYLALLPLSSVLVHPRLSLLSSRFQPSRFGLARHHQGMLLHALSIFVFDSCFLIVISLFCTDFNFLRFLVFLFTN
ncbi:hypothetical protein CK203_008728 [Vitis vinifera]|uniref:Uncharacterized protein n=1 Tax=Vitis vinifera TaxID=29760 RepID=A0A438KD72_VITVI|nr:hypothetical protein CK203_008728 [Vitis vinifera]